MKGQDGDKEQDINGHEDKGHIGERIWMLNFMMGTGDKMWIRNKIGTIWGQDWDKIGTRWGQDGDKMGSRWGQDGDKMVTRLYKKRKSWGQGT